MVQHSFGERLVSETDRSAVVDYLTGAEVDVALGAVLSPFALWMPDQRVYGLARLSSGGRLNVSGSASLELVHDVLTRSFDGIEAHLPLIESVIAEGVVEGDVLFPQAWVYDHPLYMEMRLNGVVYKKGDVHSLDTLGWMISRGVLPRMDNLLAGQSTRIERVTRRLYG